MCWGTLVILFKQLGTIPLPSCIGKVISVLQHIASLGNGWGTLAMLIGEGNVHGGMPLVIAYGRRDN
jgi:hypothetical protein